MSANLYEQTRKADLQRALAEYRDAKDNYQRLVRIALNEADPARRSEEVRAIEQENARLQRVVEGLMAAYSEGGLADDPEAQDTVIDLERELEAFKTRLGDVQKNKDRVVQLQTVLSTLTSETEKERSIYYGYIIAILVLLVIVFVLFVLSYWRSVSADLAAAAEVPQSISLQLPTTE
jgi:hypothetical protein